MNIGVTVKTGARRERVEEIAPGQYRVSIRERPIGGKANAAVIRALAAHFGIPPSTVSVKSGRASKRKIIAINAFP